MSIEGDGSRIGDIDVSPFLDELTIVGFLLLIATFTGFGSLVCYATHYHGQQYYPLPPHSDLLPPPSPPYGLGTSPDVAMARPQFPIRKLFRSPELELTKAEDNFCSYDMRDVRESAHDIQVQACGRRHCQYFALHDGAS